MTAALATSGWMVKAVILHGPGDRQVRFYLVAQETSAEAEAAVRRMPDIYPEDEVIILNRLTAGSIRAEQLQVDEVRAHVP
jgi:hypothetical protein